MVRMDRVRMGSGRAKQRSSISPSSLISVQSSVSRDHSSTRALRTRMQNTRRTPRRVSSRALSVETLIDCWLTISNASSSSCRPPLSLRAVGYTLASGAKSLVSLVRVSMSSATA